MPPVAGLPPVAENADTARRDGCAEDETGNTFPATEVKGELLGRYRDTLRPQDVIRQVHPYQHGHGVDDPVEGGDNRSTSTEQRRRFSLSSAV